MKSPKIYMYRLASNNRWFNGMQFESLAEAIDKCRKCTDSCCDVIAYVDRDTYRCVYSSSFSQAHRGSYLKSILRGE